MFLTYGRDARGDLIHISEAKHGADCACFARSARSHLLPNKGTSSAIISPTPARPADWHHFALGKRFTELGQLTRGDVIEFNAAMRQASSSGLQNWK